ncbi:hypothetical protein Sbal195_4549 (plasmid) [Shewanella baltica OS195]|uniref:DUF4145 domain-containing protein n=2 Tax=Shewanellaceae TaxID=267890 RepID=A9L6C4_SHEB9|nr:hypothetical protein Sbal195_4549 [Shewanella baltica OS195]
MAWPAAVIWMSFIFRSEVRALLSRVSSFKYKDVEASFGQRLEKAENDARLIQSPTKAKDSESENSQIEQLLRISEVSPRAAVVEAWTLIETAAIKNGLVMGGVMKRTNPKMILTHLEKSGKFSPESLKLINELRQIRNNASHLPDFAVTQSDAERYLELAVKGAAVISAANC